MNGVKQPMIPFYVKGTIYRTDGPYWNIIVVVPTQSGTFPEAVFAVDMWAATLLLYGKSFIPDAFAKGIKHLCPTSQNSIMVDLSSTTPTISSLSGDVYMVGKFMEWMTAQEGMHHDNKAKSN